MRWELALRGDSPRSVPSQLSKSCVWRVVSLAIGTHLQLPGSNQWQATSLYLLCTYSGGLQTLFIALLQGYNVILLFYHLWVLMIFAYVYRMHACAYVCMCVYIHVYIYMCVVVQVCGLLRCHQTSLSTSLHLNHWGKVSSLKLQLINRTSQPRKLALGFMSLPSSAEIAGCCHAHFLYGFWGSELWPSWFCGWCFTYWAISPALYFSCLVSSLHGVNFFMYVGIWVKMHLPVKAFS